uniref:probable receptor-like protein kinase At2g23200 n=1 Tax=Erigeron canadensis TaxID=72917 RepID=UPI001CB8A944|nr:probable receptor-like protein kinase At2g23200 [Erigeron canadensis]
MNSTLFFTTLIIVTISLLTVVVSSRSQLYDSPDHYFINCGSNSDIEFAGKTFLNDQKPNDFYVSGGSPIAAKSNSNPAEHKIYQTARIFNKKSGYELEAGENNTFVMVRLYFSPFITERSLDLSSSKFEVSVLGFTLLSDFSVENRPVMREFIVPIGDDPKFKIEFEPSNPTFPAFVNAIEAFTAPKELFIKATLPHVSPEGQNGDIQDIASAFAFNPVYRINVGGARVEVEDDRLRRIWTPDAPYIFSNTSAKNATPFDGDLRYKDGSAARYDAPDSVYKTAKQLNNNLVNATWRFTVRKSSMYLLRAHFCDILYVSSASRFNFYVYSHFNKVIELGKRESETYVPFFHDFVVESDGSEVLNVSIGEYTGMNTTVFLNGLEILELLKKSDAVSSTQTDKKKSKKVFVVVGCVIGGVALMLVLLLGFFIGLKYGKAKPAVAEAKPESNLVPSYGRSSYTSISIDFTINHPSPNLNLNLRLPFADIWQATNGFDEKLMIGKGGFGKVYKGTLPNGMIVAVKRGEKGHGQGRPEFVTEIMLLSKIRYQHLVTLIGYCDERSEMILVYEFMEKGTLQDHLYDSDKNLPKLSWDRRLEICISAARGLHYLHTAGSDGGIIHRDVKSTNILLNEKYVAKVADFGISRLDNMDEGNITGVKGSFGYLDPEYIGCMRLTQKSDVYSFGVVLLEVLCARPALDNTLPPKEANLADWAIRQIDNGMTETIIDPYVVGKINSNSLRKFLETVQRCLKETGEERPNMIDVLWDLEYALKLQQMVADKEPYEDSTMNTSLELPMSMIHRLPSNLNDDSDVNDHQSALSYPSESQVFSQLNMDEAR